jgi:hypothetical protein
MEGPFKSVIGGEGGVGGNSIESFIKFMEFFKVIIAKNLLIFPSSPIGLLEISPLEGFSYRWGEGSVDRDVGSK